jgi:hypothetical protein
MITRAVILITAFLLGACPAFAQTDWEQELGEDLVEFRDGKMIAEDYFIYTVSVPGTEETSLQVKVYGEALEDGIISRDKFVSLMTLISYQTLVTAFAESYQMSASDFMSAMDIEDLSDPIGTPDIEINLTAPNQGMQIELVNTATNRTQRSTSTWKEIYAN